MKRASKPRSRADAQRRPASYRPHLETLEDRLPLGDTLGGLLASAFLLDQSVGTGGIGLADGLEESQPAASKRTRSADESHHLLSALFSARGLSLLQGDPSDAERGSAWRFRMAGFSGRNNSDPALGHSGVFAADGLAQEPLADVLRATQASLSTDLLADDFDGRASRQTLLSTANDPGSLDNPARQNNATGIGGGSGGSAGVVAAGSAPDAQGLSPFHRVGGEIAALTVFLSSTTGQSRVPQAPLSASTSASLSSTSPTDPCSADTTCFCGTSPPVAGSRGRLSLKVSEQEFHWNSSDSILGNIDTGFLTASVWNYIPGSPGQPDRLVFIGSGDSATFHGNVLFEPYSRAVVDVTKEGRRVRYLVGGVDVAIDDPTTTSEDFRTAKFGIFRTLSPLMKITIASGTDPQPGQFQVLVDDGEDSTNDELDISSLFTFGGGEARASIPETVSLGFFPGPGQSTFRALFTEPTQVRVMYFGENRLRFKLSGEDCFVAHFLHHDAFDKTVVGINDGVEPIPSEPENRMMTNHIILNFDPITSDADISQFLLDETLRPQGITRDLGVVQVRELQQLSGTALLARIGQLDGALGPTPEDAHIDRLTDDPTTSGERYPPAFNADFLPATGDWSAIGRRFHHQHFVMQTFPAHRLIDLARDAGATIRVYMAGSGVADGRNFSGAAANQPNEYFVRGNRMFQATDITERADGRGGRVGVANPGDGGEPNNGDIRHVSDLVLGDGHDTAVLTTLAGDGVGNQIGAPPRDRNIQEIQLGSSKDVQVRIVRFPLSELAYYKQLELSAADANTRIHLVERSYSSTNQPAAPVRANLERRYRAISEAGKLIVAAAWNENGNVALADGGRIGADRNMTRRGLAGDDAFRAHVLVVGESNRVLTPNVVEAHNGVTNRGPQLSVMAPGGMFLQVRRNGTPFEDVVASSIATPLVAGIAGELMLVDPSLQQPANTIKVAEMIEATADDIDAAGPDDNTGHGRVNFWKAVLAAANDGLSAEGRTPFKGTDTYFRSLQLRDEAATTWYGFEVRTNVQNAVLWFRNNLGQFVRVQDAGQSRPPIAGAGAADVLTYMSTQANRNAAGSTLPSLPFSQAELNAAGVAQRFLARFSIRRDQLTDKTALLAVPLGMNPQDNPETVIFDIPIDDRTDLRRAQGATGANRDLIRASVKEFDDFVFHIDHAPVPQVRARLMDQNFQVGETRAVQLELRNVGATDIPVGRWIIRGQGNLLAFDDVADFGPLAAGETRTVTINMTALAAGTATLRVTILRAANTAANPVVATPVGVGADDSRDGVMTITN